MNTMRFEDMPQAMQALIQEVRELKILIHSEIKDKVQPVGQKETMSVKELCEYTGFSRSKIAQMRESGALRHYRHGKRIYFKKNEVDADLEVNRKYLKSK